MTTITTFGLDHNMRGLLDDHVNITHHCDKPLHQAPQDVLDDTDIAIIFVFSTVNKTLCQNVELDGIISLGAGTDHIDIDECHKHNISVCHTPHYGSRTVAEHTFTLLLAYERHLRGTAGKQPDTIQREAYLGQQLSGKTFGAIGTGGIGKAAINIAQGFNMNTIGSDIHHEQALSNDESFTYKDKHRVIEQADYLGLYAPATAETTNMIGRAELRAMKDDAILINTARPALIDHESLTEALRNDHVRAAVLDVVDHDYHDILAERDDTLITPHHAFYTEQALRSMAKQARDAIHSYSDGRKPETAL
jgi:D-lactate dehydrogenase